MSKQQALDRLAGADARPSAETAHMIMTALEHGATIGEIAERINVSPEILERSYPGAISEAGRRGNFRAPTDSLVVSDAPKPLYVTD
jgi:transposase-like protein